MSRKDTIIVAVLVNAGLLIVLFASALKTDSPQLEVAAVPPSQPQFASESVVKREPTPIIGDEVDQALHTYATQSAVAAAAPVIPPPQAAPVSSFAEDLKGFTAPEVPAAPLPITSTPVAVDLPNSEWVEIKVKKGDVLEKIARHHHTTVSEIMKTNHLATTNLRIGQVLKIKKQDGRVPDVRPVATAAPQQNGFEPKYYIVKKGDNPWTIAVKNHMKVEELLKLNEMSEDQARRLKPGDRLRIR